jgi:hypothetical protein
MIISDLTKPKKPQAQRKRNKASLPVRPQQSVKSVKAARKSKKNSTPTILTTSSAAAMSNNGIASLIHSNVMIPAHRPTMIIHPNDLHSKHYSKNGHQQKLPAVHQLKQESVHHHENNQFIHHNSGNLLASSQSSYGGGSSSLSSGTDDLYLKQDLMTGVCENSYESSEDTGVGGLSENELISPDVIGNFDMESCAELSKVLSSLPSNALDDLLTGN